MAHFVRTRPAPTVKGAGYARFRSYVRSDFRETCSYCLIAELFAHGEENFELDHFRPRSLFPNLKDDFYNLHWACHPCNHKKRDWWPDAALEVREIGFVDLTADDAATHYKVLDDGGLEGLTTSANHTIDKLLLNRKHLVKMRRLLRELAELDRPIASGTQ